MIDLYTWTTPNGRKISIMLEECALPYKAHKVSLDDGDQFKSDFVALSPNCRIPAIYDQATETSVFESGAILFYLGEKTGKFLPSSGKARVATMEWLMFQMANTGPMLGQANHFANGAPEQIPYAIERYLSESARLVKVLDDRLASNEFLAGDYSIADIANYTWITLGFELLKAVKPEITGEGANVARWLAAIAARPAVVAGMAVPQ